jgi:hypothetical protein
MPKDVVNLHRDITRMYPLKYMRWDPVKPSKNCRENAKRGNYIPGRVSAPK